MADNLLGNDSARTKKAKEAVQARIEKMGAASDEALRAHLILLASDQPKGSENRRAILAMLKR